MSPLLHHLSSERLLDFVDGRLTPAEQSSVEAHLASCAACSSQAAAFKRVITVMRSDATQDAPEHMVNRAIRLFRTRHPRTAEPSLRRRVVAALRLDSAQQRLAFGMRAAPQAARELLFDIDDESELEVRIEPAEGGWRVAGQVLGACTGGQVLLEGSAGQAATELNAQCEFSLPPQPGAIYKLLLRLENFDVEVPILELRG